MELEIVLAIICLFLVTYIAILIIVMIFWLRFKKNIFKEFREDPELGLVLYKADSDSLTSHKLSSESLSGTNLKGICLNKDHQCYGMPATCLHSECDSEEATIRSFSSEEEEVIKNRPKDLLKGFDRKQEEYYSKPITLMNIEVKEEPLQTTKPKSIEPLDALIVASPDQKDIKNENEKPKKDTESEKSSEPVKDSEEKSSDTKDLLTIRPRVVSPNISSENEPKDTDVDISEIDDDEYKLVCRLKS